LPPKRHTFVLFVKSFSFVLKKFKGKIQQDIHVNLHYEQLVMGWI